MALEDAEIMTVTIVVFHDEHGGECRAFVSPEAARKAVSKWFDELLSEYRVDELIDEHGMIPDPRTSQMISTIYGTRSARMTAALLETSDNERLLVETASGSASAG